jgi:hypothetical protein
MDDKEHTYVYDTKTQVKHNDISFITVFLHTASDYYFMLKHNIFKP